MQLTLCQRLLHASGVFGPPVTVVPSNNSEISLHTSSLNPLSVVLDVSLCRSRTLMRISVSCSDQCADFFLSFGNASEDEVDIAKR